MGKNSGFLICSRLITGKIDKGLRVIIPIDKIDYISEGHGYTTILTNRDTIQVIESVDKILIALKTAKKTAKTFTLLYPTDEEV